MYLCLSKYWMPCYAHNDLFLRFPFKNARPDLFRRTRVDISFFKKKFEIWDYGQQIYKKCLKLTELTNV